MKNLSRSTVLSSLSLLALVTTTFVAGCSEEEETLHPAPSTPDASDSGETCAPGHTGIIQLVVTGLPDGVAGKAKLAGPSGSVDASSTSTLTGQPSGTYSVTAERVTKPDPIVRTVYDPTITTSSFCLGDAQTVTVTISYAAIPSSNMLWSTNANSESGHLLAFSSASLGGAAPSPSATVAMKGVGGSAPGKAIAFDKDGNLWSFGATVGDAALLRFPAAVLGASGEKTPDIAINPQLTGCSPAFTGAAFDPNGALWATVLCSNQVLRIGPDKLTGSSDYTPAADEFASGVTAPRHVAFDSAGNMWVSDDASIVMFPSASLAAGQAHTSTFKIHAKAENDAELPPDALAFDKDGNLWVTNFGGNLVYKLTPSDLTPSGTEKTLVPSVAITVSVGALLESLAFDESGGLWMTYSQGKVARLAPEQLGTSTTSGDPTIPTTIVTSGDIGYAGGLAFFPAPAALPMYSRVP